MICASIQTVTTLSTVFLVQMAFFLLAGLYPLHTPSLALIPMILLGGGCGHSPSFSLFLLWAEADFLIVYLHLISVWEHLTITAQLFVHHCPETRTRLHTQTAAVSRLSCVFALGVVLQRSHHTAFSQSMWLLQPELRAPSSHSSLPSAHYSGFICQAVLEKATLRALVHPLSLI